MTSLSDALHKGEGFEAGDPETIIFGNKRLSRWERDAVLFDDSSNFSVVMLPFTTDKGHKVPDFNKLDKFNELQRIIADHPGISKTELAEEARKKDINIDEIDYDYNTNTISLKNTMAFITVQGYASGDTIDLTDQNTKYLEKVDKEEGQHLQDYYNNMIKHGTLRPSKRGNTTIKGYSTAGKKDF